jgi:sugar/nucleoside kinase (ribokinase family)
MHDVYAYGVIAPSTLLELADEYPPAAGYAEIVAAHPSIGGEAAGSAYVLARLGIRTKLAGNRLGRDAESARVIDVLSSAGVDCSAIPLVGDRPSVTEVVIAAGDSRTVFGSYRQLVVDRAWDGAAGQDVRSSRIVCLDPFFGEASLEVARWCSGSGTPYVTVDVSPDSEVARHADVLIISEEFATRTMGSDPHEVLAAFTARCRGLVVLTQGSGGVLAARHDAEPQEHPTFAVDVRDTTGAGDSFRAGVIYGMLRGFDTARTIRTASAVAALVCERAPGVLHGPTEPELEAFLGLRS